MYIHVMFWLKYLTLKLLQDQHIEDLSRRLSRGFAATDGIFVKALDDALSSFNVERQAYYGGTFIGNHVHRCLEVHTNIHV